MLHQAQPTTPTSSGEALTELYRLYAAEAFRFAVHLTGRKEDAEDVLQQVFLQAHRHLESGAGLVNPRAWLMIAVKHRVFNLQRARRETPAAEIEPGAAHAAPTEEAEELTAVRGVLWTLPEKQHHAFVLRYWSGLSQSEIAQVLGTTASAVESLLVRARTTLISERANGSDECERVRLRLVEGGQLTDRNHDHLKQCSRCRAGHLRLSHIAEFASIIALAPRLHVAHGLAAAVPGFSAPAATLSAVSAPAAAGVSTAAGASTAATAVGASGKVAMAVKVALAVAATTAAAATVPPVHSKIDRVLFPHPVVTAAAATLSRPAAAGANAGSGGAGPGLAHPVPAAGSTTPGSNGRHAGAGNAGGAGSPHGKAVGHGSGKAKGQGNGNANGHGNGKAKGQGNGNANGQGNGKANGSANGQGNGQAKGSANGKAKGTAKSKTTGAAKGAAKGKTTGAAKGKAKGAAKGNATGQANGNGNGNAGSNGNGKGATKSTS